MAAPSSSRDRPFDYDAFLDAAVGELPPEPPTRPPVEDDEPPLDDDDPDSLDAALNADLVPSEFTVTPSGQVRQAGAAPEAKDTPLVAELRVKAERSLFTFAKGVLGRRYLTPELHGAFCQHLTDFSTTRRKGGLLPRECGKTSIVSHALPLHIQIQPKAANLYVPGEAGCEQRIVLACETQSRGKDHLEVQRRTWIQNELLRALWPACVWENARRDAPRWNNIEYDIPHTGHWPDPSVRTIGVGGAITGAHPTILIKDDLISVEAANSALVMQTAIDWHIASRALINQPQCLEFIIGTRWAVHDLYSHIQQTDPSVRWYIRQLIEDGRCIYPPPAGPFSPEKIRELQETFGPQFLLLYMNSAADPNLVDFDLSLLRTYRISEGLILLEEDQRDLLLREEADPALQAEREAARFAAQAKGKSVSEWLKGMAEHDARRQAHLRPFARINIV